jgi:hypothetical protein
MAPVLFVCRSRMSSWARPLSTISLSSARYFAACAAQGSLGLKSSRPTRAWTRQARVGREVVVAAGELEARPQLEEDAHLAALRGLAQVAVELLLQLGASRA